MKRLFFVITIFLLSLFTITVSADTCTNEEKARLKKEAAKVKLVYEEAEELIQPTKQMIAEGTTEPIENPYFKMKIVNITDEMTVHVDNDYNDKVITAYNGVINNGTYEFDWKDVYDIVKFTYRVFGSSSSSCSNELLFTGYLVTPKYNYYADAGICKGISDYKYCSKYITFDVDSAEQYNIISEYRKETEKKQTKKSKNSFEKVLEYIKEHKTMTIAISSVIVVGGAGYVIIRNNRKRVK